MRKNRGMARPTGEIALALLAQARIRPGTVLELARRAQVGYAAARYTASRLQSTGRLVPLTPNTRPAVLGIPSPRAADDAESFGSAGADLAAALGAWGR
jgi:hypothetical protein